MAIEIIGKLIKKLPVQSGSSARGEWKKQEFIIETQETYAKKICMNVWGAESVSDLARYSEGETLKVSVNIESREYNQRWYTDIRAWRIEKGAGDNTPAQNIPETDMGVGFNAEEADDLPF